MDKESDAKPSPPSSATSKAAAPPPDASLDRLIHESSPEMLAAVAADPRLNEDLALALLERRDLPAKALEQLNRHKSLARQRKVRMAIVMHPHTPRHVSVPTIRHLYPFELMQVALLPSVPADVKRAAEEVLIAKLATITSGERSVLAKQGSGRIAAALLLDKEERIMRAALENPQMTEMWIVKALKAEAGTELLAPAVSRHQKWVHRTDVKSALLANKHTPLDRIAQFAADLPLNAIKDVLRNARLAPNVKTYLANALGKRTGPKT